MAMISSWNIVLKSSGGGGNTPASIPRRRFAGAGASSSGITRTMGLPALAITKDSPRDAASTSLERWVLASWMLTDFTATPEWP